MALTKRRRMTEENLEAHRRNAQLSRGPATPEGRERMRDAHLRHGFYSRDDRAALRALGENPAELQALREGLGDEQTAAIVLQEQLADRLARAVWRMKRADRMQEGYALRQAREEEKAREGRLHMQMMRLKLTSRNWFLLAQSVARPQYLTTRRDLNAMRELHKEGAAKEMSEVALALFYQLREPWLPSPGDLNFQDAEQQEQQRQVLNKIKAIFGLDPLPEPGEEQYIEASPASSPAGQVLPPRYGPHAGMGPAGQGETAPVELDANRGMGSAEGCGALTSSTVPPVGTSPRPERSPARRITEQQWEAREPVRQLLENILRRQVELFEAQHQYLLRQSLAGPSSFERAAEIVPTHPHSQLIQRMEDANFRQVLKVAHLLLRAKRETRLGSKRKRAE